MFKKRWMAVIFFVGLLLQAFPAVHSQTAIREIHITAKKYEYSPAEIRLRQGERIRLLVTATDRKHGFEIKELGIKATLEKGRETAIEFLAPQPGEYEMRCSVFCGFGHKGMRGKLIVEAAE